jgi:hypothetical protein
VGLDVDMQEGGTEKVEISETVGESLLTLSEFVGYDDGSKEGDA